MPRLSCFPASSTTPEQDAKAIGLTIERFAAIEKVRAGANLAGDADTLRLIAVILEAHLDAVVALDIAAKREKYEAAMSAWRAKHGLLGEEEIGGDYLLPDQPVYAPGIASSAWASPFGRPRHAPPNSALAGITKDMPNPADFGLDARHL